MMMKKMIFLLLFSSCAVLLKAALPEKIEIILETTVVSKSASTDFDSRLASVTGAYRMTKNLSLGMGVGAMFFKDGIIKNSLPVFLYGKWSFTNNSKFTPFISVKCGYGFSERSERLPLTKTRDTPSTESNLLKYTGGIFASFSDGVSYHLRGKTRLFVSLSNDIHQMHIKNETTGYANTHRNSAIGLNIGISF
ncbi:MAG TPA: hypothetical protein DDZ78_04030 [Porphyromonadaceae bacterium]|nr:hypothetical protein [Porphyromonadaceae bacterium]